MNRVGSKRLLCPECGGKLRAVIDSRSALNGMENSRQGHPVVSNKPIPFHPIIQGGYL